MTARTHISLESLPVRTELPDGGALLAEADAYRVLEGGRLAQSGGMVAPAKLRLVRNKAAGNHVRYELVVEPADPDDTAAGARVVVQLSARTSLAPAKLSGLRHGKHAVKPKGEPLAKAVLNSPGADIDLIVLEVRQKAATPLLGAVGLAGAKVAVGFQEAAEAKGWHLYVSAVLGVVDEAEGRTFESMCAKAAGGHQAHTLGALYEGLAA